MLRGARNQILSNRGYRKQDFKYCFEFGLQDQTADCSRVLLFLATSYIMIKVGPSANDRVRRGYLYCLLFPRSAVLSSHLCPALLSAKDFHTLIHLKLTDLLHGFIIFMQQFRPEMDRLQLQGQTLLQCVFVSKVLFGAQPHYLSSGHYNRRPWTGWLVMNINFSQSSRLGSLQSRQWLIQSLVNALFLICNWSLSCFILTWWGERVCCTTRLFLLLQGY